MTKPKKKPGGPVTPVLPSPSHSPESPKAAFIGYRHIGVSLPDDIARRLRIEAAEKDCSRSEFCAQIIREYFQTKDTPQGDRKGVAE